MNQCFTFGKEEERNREVFLTALTAVYNEYIFSLCLSQKKQLFVVFSLILILQVSLEPCNSLFLKNILKDV